MQKLFFVMAVSIGLLGCKQAPSEKYEEVINSHKIYESFAQAQREVEPISNLKDSSSHQMRLSLQDSAIQINAEATYVSNFHIYDIYELDLQTNYTYTIHIKAYCDCFGASKYIFYPEVTLIDRYGKLIPITVESEMVYEPKWTNPVHIERIFSFNVNHDMPYSLFVYANNSILNKELIRSSSSTPIQTNPYTFYVDVPYKVKAYPIGKYEIQLKKNNPHAFHEGLTHGDE